MWYGGELGDLILGDWANERMASDLWEELAQSQPDGVLLKDRIGVSSFLFEALLEIRVRTHMLEVHLKITEGPE